jgi:hypothetical protein
MNETCDRCGPATGAAYRVDRVSELYLCGQCATRHWRALSAQGWTFWPWACTRSRRKPARRCGVAVAAAGACCAG